MLKLVIVLVALVGMAMAAEEKIDIKTYEQRVSPSSLVLRWSLTGV